MENTRVVWTEHLTKKYNLYARPQDRFREAVGIRHKSLHNDFYALRDINFDVCLGETVGIIGTNGSGKSTLLKIITGVLKPSSGQVEVKGRISALLELGAGFNQEYTGLENIYLNGRMMGYSRREMEARVPAIVDFADIGEFITQPVKTYSSGMFARLAFAVAINVEPDILIVDEALSVGDLFFQNKCFRKFEELKEKGITILFVSHDISSVRQMCSRALWIEKGIQKSFGPSDLICDMYMDEKRQQMNQQSTTVSYADSQHLVGNQIDRLVTFPSVNSRNSAIESSKLQIQSVFVMDKDNRQVTCLEVEHSYSFHVVARLFEDMDDLIFGVVAENNKGIPLYDFNNFINADKVIRGLADQTIEVIFSFTLPRVMRGSYLISAAVAQGTQTNHVMLTWLHGVMQLEIINPGYNSSYIEIPAKVQHNIYPCKNVKIV